MEKIAENAILVKAVRTVVEVDKFFHFIAVFFLFDFF